MAAVEVLPPGWTVHQSKSKQGRTFYYNAATQERRWEPPPVDLSPKRRPEPSNDVPSAKRQVSSNVQSKLVHVVVERLGSIPIQLDVKNAPSVSAAIEALARQGVSGRLHRVEPIPPPPGDGPPYALVQSTLADSEGLLAKAPIEGTNPVVRGSVCLVQGTSDFFISLAAHPGWEVSMAVFGSVDNTFLERHVEPVLQHPCQVSRHPRFGTLMSMLETPLPLRLVLDGESTASQESSKANSGSSAQNEVRALHILVKHRDSRKPRSWRNGDREITISRDQALAKLDMLRSRLTPEVEPARLRERFAALARTESDCSSAKRGGDLGCFGFAKMQRPFSEAAFGLKEYELSVPVDTASGVHMILRVPLVDD